MKLTLNAVVWAAVVVAVSTRSLAPTTGLLKGRRASIAGRRPVTASDPAPGS